MTDTDGWAKAHADLASRCQKELGRDVDSHAADSLPYLTVGVSAAEKDPYTEAMDILQDLSKRAEIIVEKV